MKTLFEETDLNGLRMKSRLVRSATGENLATPEGHIIDDLMTVYKELAEGGVGMIILSFTSVAPVDHFNDGLLRLHDDSLIPQYEKLVHEIHEHDCRVMPQLALGIYQRLDGNGHYQKVDVNRMEQEDINEVIRKFVTAADRAKRAGFDGVQLHGCHGFVLSSFLGPSNHRRDMYGGSVKGRAKIVQDIIKGIREKSGDIHISIKINGGDMPPEELLETCGLLVEAGLDSIEYEGYYSDLVPALQKLNVPVILTGGHREMEKMELLLNSYNVDYFGMSRPLIREPDLPDRWKRGIKRPADCVSCGMCMSTYGYRCALIPQKFGKAPRRNR